MDPAFSCRINGLYENNVCHLARFDSDGDCGGREIRLLVPSSFERASILRRERGHQLFKAGITAQRIPKWVKPEITIASITRSAQERAQVFNGKILLASSGAIMARCIKS
jgi:hypothetical protein